MNTHVNAARNHNLPRGRSALYRFVTALSAVALALGVMGVPAVEASQPVWRDDFTNASLDPAWFWLNENPDGWDLIAEPPGFLQIDTTAHPTGGENLLLRSGALGNFTIETHLLFAPGSNFQFAGLVIYQDQANFLQLGRAFCDVPDACVGNGIYFDYIRDGDLVDGNFATTTDVTDEAYLRLQLSWRSITAFYSENGVDWLQIGRHEVPLLFRVNAVGLTSSQNYRGEEIAADFDYFSLTGQPRPWGPFVGTWRAIDNLDGSLMRVTITGPASGPFLITWTESYFSGCNGTPGLAAGRGQLSPADPYVLEVDMRLRCFRTGDVFDWHQVWQYRLAYDVLASQDENGVETIWVRPGRPLVPRMDLRVNYGHDWVESFYEAGHTVSVTVTESDGVTVRAMIDVETEPKDYWGGETGFQSLDGEWDPGVPDIQPGDWVYAQVDNGLTARVQIGEISGTIEPGADSITGPIAASWFAGEVNVECMPWGAPEPQPGMKSDAVLPDGHNPYSCSWAGEWDIQPYQDVGVAYFGLDGHWVANAFFASGASMVASTAGDWFWASGFSPQELLTYAVYDSRGGNLLNQGTVTCDDTGFVFVGNDVHLQNLEPGNYVTITDGSTLKGLVLELITMDVFDLEQGIMGGTAPSGRSVLVVAADSPDAADQTTIETFADEDGAWSADFDLTFTDEWRPWSFAQIFDEDGDAYEAGAPPPPEVPTMFAWLEWDAVDGHNWPQDSTITLTVGAHTLTQTTGPGETSVHFDLVRTHDLIVGDVVTMSDGHIVKSLTIPHIEITDFNLIEDTVAGLYDFNLAFYVRVADQAPPVVSTVDASWVATFEDLRPLMWGDAVQTDEDGDSVSATIRTPGPGMYAVPDEDRVYAWEWTPGETLYLSIVRQGEPQPWFDSSLDVPDTGDLYGGEVLFDLTFDLLAGDVIHLTDWRYDKELAVSSLSVTDFDIEGQNVLGIGDLGARFYVLIEDEQVWGNVVEGGGWSVQNTKLRPGVWGSAIQPDEDGDETRDIFQAPGS